MKTSCSIAIALLVFAGSGLPLRAADLAIVGARIYPAPDAQPIERGSVLMRDGRIVDVGTVDAVKVPAQAEVLDGQGLVVVAGFWNSHVHLLPVPLREASSRPAAELTAALQAMLTRWGFTTVFDIGSLHGTALALRGRVESGEVTGPKILTTDALFFPQDGTPFYVRELFQQLNVPSMEVADAEQARRRARQQFSEGADGIKLMTGAIVGGKIDVLPMDIAIAKALVREGHRAHKPVFAHPTNLPGLEIAIASGVDVLAHTTPTIGDWPPELVASLVKAEVALIPTLSLFEDVLGREGAPQEVVQKYREAGQQQLGAFSKAGGTALFGTDVGYIELADTSLEYELMAGAGLSWRQILASLTTSPAQRFGHARHKGRIAKGMDADLVVLNRDPAETPKALADVRYTIRAGKVIYMAAGKDAPSRAAPERCAWEKLRDAALSLAAWVQRCDYGFRKLDFVIEGQTLMLRFTEVDTSTSVGITSYPVVEVIDLIGDETPEAGVKRIFEARTDKGIAARCVLAPFDDAGGSQRSDVKRYVFVPNPEYGAELKTTQDPNDVPEPPCGDLGVNYDGIVYFETQPQSGVRKVLFVNVGQDDPQFDAATLRLIP
jgi:imidazolonepropionase-like amidohydrolase